LKWIGLGEEQKAESKEKVNSKPMASRMIKESTSNAEVLRNQ